MNLKRLHAFAVATTLVFTGCMTESRDYTYDDLRYRELRIDGVTNHWLYLRAASDSVHGDTLFVASRGYVLVDKSLDKSAGLTYRFDTTEYGRDVFYPVKDAPENFTCLIHQTRAVRSDSLPSAATVLREIQFTDSTATVLHYFPDPDPVEAWIPIFCDYFPGRGFRLSPYLMMGEYVIRY